ncbi:MAG: LysM domain-containing protein [Deltaproteobacteria bacterium]|nr:LysM domain-containing protein [Deltaproteobacteria bacterium]
MRCNFHDSEMELDPDGLMRQDRMVISDGNDRRRSSRGTSSSVFKPFRILLAASALFIIFLVVFCLYFPADSDEDESGVISGIYDNLARINEEIESLAMDLDSSKDQFGDRLDGIAIELAGLNKKLDALASGYTPAHPGAALIDKATGNRVHVVRKGENVFSIARKNGISVKDFCAWNGITASEIIQPGQKLLLQ